MNKVLLCISFALFGLTAQAQDVNEFILTVEISGFKTDKGHVYISLFNTEEQFLKKGIKSAKVIIDNNFCSATFEGLKKGEYAVSLFHDENQNDKMDTKIFGIPKEPYGFSNNAKALMGPPKFKDAKFSLAKNKTIVISLQ